MLIKFCENDSYLLENLSLGQLFFNNIYNLNDPFEGLFRYRLSSNENDFKEFFLNHFPSEKDKLSYYFENKHELEIKINKVFEYRAKNNAISCFSDHSCLTNVLMWSHYANKHQGCCLVFDNKLSFNLAANFEEGVIIAPPTGAHKVEYIKDYLNTDPLQAKLNQQKFLTTKFDTWKYEKEFRFISPRAGLHLFAKKRLKKVVFGLRMSPSLRESIERLIDNDPNYVDVRFEQIQLAKDKFKFELKNQKRTKYNST